MLGGNCSQCCTPWRCYDTEDADPPIKPTGLSVSVPECVDETAVTVKLQWTAPVPGDCVPDMTYDVDISTTSTGPWQPAKLAGGGTAYGITRETVVTNNVSLQCEYAAFFPESAQVDYFRANNLLLTRRVYFRVRSDARSGPFINQTSDWTVSDPVNDPRYCTNNYSEVYVAAPPVTYFEVPLDISHSGYTPEGCSTPNAEVDVFAITSTVSATLPDPAVKTAMYYNTTSAVTLGLPLNAAGDPITGTGLLPYDEDVVALWVMVQMPTAPEVLSIIKMGLDF